MQKKSSQKRVGLQWENLDLYLSISKILVTASPHGDKAKGFLL